MPSYVNESKPKSKEQLNRKNKLGKKRKRIGIAFGSLVKSNYFRIELSIVFRSRFSLVDDFVQLLNHVLGQCRRVMLREQTQCL